MADITTTPIPDITTSWENYSGERVEEFIKKQLTTMQEQAGNLNIQKGSHLALLSVDESTNMASVGIFASQESYATWQKNPDDNGDLLLSSVEIPMGSGGGSTESSYIVKLTNMGSKSITATSTEELKARVRFTSQIYDPSDKSLTDSDESASLQIETHMQGSSDWKVAGTMDIQSQSSSDASAYTEIDLSPYCVSGTQSIRMIARGESSDKKTQYVSLTVTLTNIQVTFQTNWQRPFEYKAVSPTIQVPVLITGTINKTLHLKVTSADEKYSREYEYNVGTTAYTETPYTASVDHPVATGIYTIEAWITSGDAVRTSSVSQNIMCTLVGNTKPLLVINNVGKFQNWSSVHAFDYALYNPSGDNMDISFILTNSETSAVIFNELVQGVQSGVIGSLIFNLEIETESNEDFPAIMSFTSGSIVLRDPLGVKIENTENFAPVSGADFFLNPKARNNSESNPATIINYMNKQEVEATFEGLSFVSDGWVIDSETNARCLRLLEGQKVDIKYDAYSDDTALQGLTIELDFATRNVVNEEGILLQMGTPSTTDKFLVGLWVKAQESNFMSTQNRSEGAQNWIYSKEKRTHVAVNIVPNLYNQGVNYVRVFINGIISREFTYADSDMFWQSVDGVKKTGGIVIAPQGADIDIYGLRIYKKSMSANDIRQNYLSSMATIEEKKAFKSANDILGENGLISYAKAYEKYNTLLYMGSVPSLKFPDATVGDVIIHKQGDPEHSGTLHNMTRKGQGSTSKKYWTWNIQSDFKGDAETNYWEDENGVNHGQCYQNAEGLPMAKKLVDKRNWASSMQSHKMGATKLYNDVYQEVVGKNEITSISGKENCRVCVYEDPFLVFQQTEDDAEPVFIGMGTFGSGKADKPTFGYDKENTPDMLMIEGSDNNPRLTKHQMPWIEGDVYYDENEEGYVYKTNNKPVTSWDYDLGNQETISRFIEAFNFVYSYSNRLKPFVGTPTQLNAASSDDVDTSYCYWVTRAENNTARYDMFTFNEISQTWVPGGVTKDEEGNYATLNVKEQLKSYLGSDFTNHENVLNWELINEDFIKARRQVFTARIGNYFHKKDIMYFMCMMKLIAASDNRAKNTYFWVKDAKSLIRAFQDDLDSIFPVENQGQLKKPYWVEEHDLYADGSHYWNGADNALYNMMEECFPTDLRSTMNEILSAMARLGGGTVMSCWEKYFLSTCQYFPAVAYNEMARIGYEYAHYQMVNGNYNNDTDPITQSLGSQEEGERQWLSDRTIYMSSYAMYGEFNPSAPSGGNIIYRSIDNKEITYNLTMAMWLYPVASVGQSIVLSGIRCKAGESISASGMPSDNTQSGVCGVNYMSDIGTWYDKPANGTFAFNGSRVKNLVAGTDNVNDIRLKATALNLKPMKSLRTLDIHNLSTLTGVLDVSNNSRLESVDARGTSITGISLPSQEFLTSVKLPATITDLKLDGFKGLGELTLEEWDNLKTLYVNQATCPNIDTLGMVEKLKDNTQLSSLTLLGVDWSDMTVETLTWLLDKQVKVTGKIAMASGESIDATLKMRIVGLWGNVDDESNSLYMSYNKVSIVSATLSGKAFFSKIGTYQLSLDTVPTTGNNLTGIAWSISDNDFATINEKTGVITTNKVGTEENDDKAVVTASISLANGKTIETSLDVYFYRYSLKLGDYLFSDGSGYNKLLPNLTSVGICFYINPKNRNQGLFVASNDLKVPYRTWGLFGRANEVNAITNIVLDDNPNVNVYDVSLVPNVNSFDVTISDSNIRDESNVENDGFKEYNDSSWGGGIGFTQVSSAMYGNVGLYLANIGLSSGDVVSKGLIQSLYIMAHRDIVLQDSSITLSVPEASNTESLYDNITKCIDNLVAKNNNLTKYSQYYFPAASYCNAYEPNITNKETLAAGLKAGNWYLPSHGEIARLCWFALKGYDGAEWAIFSNAFQQNAFTKMTGYLYSSAETPIEGFICSFDVSTGKSSYSAGQNNVNKANTITLANIRPVVAYEIKD